MLRKLEYICASPGLGITNPKWARDSEGDFICDNICILITNLQHFLSAYRSCVLVYIILSGVGDGKVAGGTFFSVQIASLI